MYISIYSHACLLLIMLVGCIASHASVLLIHMVRM